jgi:membrane protease YdiL (CAAX protease family)
VAEEPIAPRNDDLEPPAAYPRVRFVALLLIVVVLLLSIGIAQRRYSPTSESSSFSEKALQADIAMKMSYAYQRWFPAVPEGATQNRIGVFADTQKRSAVAWYTQVVRENPSADHIRRLVILEGSSAVPLGIERMEEMGRSRPRLASEAVMWRTIYSSADSLAPAQVTAYASRIRGLELGWYEHLALADLYGRAGLSDRAGQEREKAEQTAVWTVTAFIGVVALIIILGATGTILMILYVVAKRSRRSAVQDADYGQPPHVRSFVAGYLLEAFVVYLAIVIGTQIAAAAVLVTGKPVNSNGAEGEIVLTVVVYVLSGVFSLLYLRWRLRMAGWSWAAVGLTSRNLGADIGWGIAGYASALPLVLVAGLMSRALSRYIETPSNPVVPMFVESNTLFERAILLVLVAVAAPFFEELFFRGVLYHSFRAAWGVVMGILSSAVVFGLVHPLPLDFLPIFALGSVFATLVYERGSLLPAMIAHSLNNTAAFAVLLILMGS